LYWSTVRSAVARQVKTVFATVSGLLVLSAMLWGVFRPEWRKKITAAQLVGAVSLLVVVGLIFVVETTGNPFRPAPFSPSAMRFMQDTLLLGIFVVIIYVCVRGLWKKPAVAVLVALLSAVAVIGMQLYLWVGIGARDLMDTGLTSNRLSVVGIPIDYAAVHWIDPARKPASIVEMPQSSPASPPHLLIILNQTATTYALYDCRTGEPHIVSAADVVVDRSTLHREPTRVCGSRLGRAVQSAVRQPLVRARGMGNGCSSSAAADNDGARPGGCASGTGTGQPAAAVRGPRPMSQVVRAASFVRRFHQEELGIFNGESLHLGGTAD
jgi:hypothetical protein